MGKNSDNDSSQSIGDWQPISTFVVEFQQRATDGDTGQPRIGYRSVVHNLEAGDGDEWEGLVERELSEWMLSRTVEAAGKAYLKQLPEHDDSVVRMPVRLTLEEIEVQSNHSLRAVCTNDGVFSGYVSHALPVGITVRFQVVGMNDHDKVGCYMIGFSALRIADGKRFFLGWSPMEHKLSSKTSVEIKEINLEPGIYTLRVTAVLENCRPRLAFMEASLLVVV